MNIKEDSSYIRGLLEGLSIDNSKPEGKIISALVEIIDKMAAEIEKVKDDVKTCGDYVEEIDEDLGSLEEVVYGDCDCGCDCDDDSDDDCGCGCSGDCDCDGEFYETVCDGCGEKYYFDENADPEEVVCPVCKKPLIDEEDEDDGEDKKED